MVSDLESHLGRRGFGMIAPALGASRLADELQHGDKGDVEVIVAGELGSMIDGPNPSANGSASPSGNCNGNGCANGNGREPHAEPADADGAALNVPAGGVAR
jgi:hypothetical protein